MSIVERQHKHQRLAASNAGVIAYERVVPCYRSQGKAVVQTIHVSEYGSDHVKIRLFVNGIFAGDWIKTTPHFRNIVKWGSWKLCKGPILVQQMGAP